MFALLKGAASGLASFGSSALINKPPLRLAEHAPKLVFEAGALRDFLDTSQNEQSLLQSHHILLGGANITEGQLVLSVANPIYHDIDESNARILMFRVERNHLPKAHDRRLSSIGGRT